VGRRASDKTDAVPIPRARGLASSLAF